MRGERWEGSQRLSLVAASPRALLVVSCPLPLCTPGFPSLQWLPPQFLCAGTVGRGTGTSVSRASVLSHHKVAVQPSQATHSEVRLQARSFERGSCPQSLIRGQTRNDIYRAPTAHLAHCQAFYRCFSLISPQAAREAWLSPSCRADAGREGSGTAPACVRTRIKLMYLSDPRSCLSCSRTGHRVGPTQLSRPGAMFRLREVLSFQERQVTGQRAHLVMSFSRRGQGFVCEVRVPMDGGAGQQGGVRVSRVGGCCLELGRP